MEEKITIEKLKSEGFVEWEGHLINKEGTHLFKIKKDLSLRQKKINTNDRSNLEKKSHNYGYSRIVVNNTNHYLHKVMWLIFKGEIPAGKVVTHIDKDKMNNNIDNLKLTVKGENSRKWMKELGKRGKSFKQAKNNQ